MWKKAVLQHALTRSNTELRVCAECTDEARIGGDHDSAGEESRVSRQAEQAERDLGAIVG